MLKIVSEDQLLNEEVRKALIEQWDDTANQQRKAEAFKAYECLKDKTVNYVLDLLLKQFDTATVIEMQYAMSNISIFRKVIDKLAKVYSNGVKRTMPAGENTKEVNEAETQTVEETADLLRMNAVMKKTNRYFRAFKNTLVYVRPLKQDSGKYAVKVEALPPFYYDVVEDPNNPELPLAIVLSDYSPSRQTLYSLGDAASAGRSNDDGAPRLVQSNVRPIASVTAGSEDKREFVWWTKNFHFTTNAKGVVIDSGDGTNPILKLPFVNFAGEQDGQFWAEGGSDLVDAGVKINTLITNVNHVAISQGYGQLYMTGENLPKSVKVGPNHCVQLIHTKDQSDPTIGYLNSNPPISDLRGLVEMYVALMLTTNNLSTSGFSTSLQGGRDFASGIALMIDKSESIEDINEQSQIFVEKEPQVFDLVYTWTEVYRALDLLVEEFAALKPPKDPLALQVNFPPPMPILSESERLDILEKRMTLGLNTMVEIIMRDDPSLSEEEAKAKLKQILEEKMARMEAAMVEGANGDQDQEGDGEPGEDGDGDQFDGRASDSGAGQGEGEA